MKSVFLALIISFVAGCTTANQTLSNASDIALNIDEDAVQMNESHTKAINSVIAVNVLRARDRMPTGYTTLSGITNQPTRQFNLDAELSPIGLGNPVNPLGQSKIIAKGTRGASAQYSVNPFAGGKGSQSLYTTSESDVFLSRYWQANWPKDVLISLFVRKGELNGDACVLDGKGNFASVAENGSSSKHSPTAENDSKSGCEALAEILHTKGQWEDLLLGMSANYNCSTGSICTKREEPLQPDACEPMDAKLTGLLFSSGEQTLATRIRSIEKAAGGKTLLIGKNSVSLCKKRASSKLMLLQKNGDGYSIILNAVELRSFDDMVYFLGESLRPEFNNRWKVKCEGKNVPLFDLKRQKEANKGLHYNMEFSYAGQKWRGLPVLEDANGCAEGRTGTVLAILSQIFVLSQSKEFLEAPDILLAR